MTTEIMETLAAEWLLAKEAERAAMDRRRELEDKMRAAAKHDDTQEGTSTLPCGTYRVKVVSRIDRKVDAELVQELAAEHGLTQHLIDLFRWKPEINASAWKSADPAITNALAPAITAKPGRPSFAIELSTKE
jgi:hypothetical protein